MPENKFIRSEKIRNLAIIAHVDHGKTTLVDAMFRQTGIFREGQEVTKRVMDNMDLERERGITIAAKNCAVTFRGVRLNIIDTPGHADFGGEVERSLAMADGAILLVDAAEGPLPQTRFVLSKALKAGLPIIVILNKMDRKDARPDEVLNDIYDLFIDLGANEDVLDFPVLYAFGKQGAASLERNLEGKDLTELFETVLEQIPPPAYNPNEPFQMLTADLGHSDYLGRLAIGKVVNGKATQGESLVRIGQDGQSIPLRVTRLMIYNGPKLEDTQEASPGDIVVLSGLDDVEIGDTICSASDPRPLPRIKVDEPTVSMTFGINTSPLAGREGKIVQSSRIKERLEREALRNVAIKVENSKESEAFVVKGRGEFQLAILVETMRREGFELCVGRPEVILRREGDKILEPIEEVTVDVEESYTGTVTENLSKRKGRLVWMTGTGGSGSDRVQMIFSLPTRGLIGFRDEFLTMTKGTGILNTSLSGYEEYRGEFASRRSGAIVADRPGNAVAYALFHLEPRGELFISPGEPVYEGMIVGVHNREKDLDVNPCKEKKLTNLRASGKDENIILTPARPMTLERAINFLRDDELLEVTPLSIRPRKAVLSLHGRRSMKSAKGQVV